MQLSAFLNVIRWKNLLLILYIQLVIKFLFFPYFLVNTQLSTVQFSFLVIAILCITAAGYIINDIFDVKADKINKPNKVFVTTVIAKETAKKWYLYLNSAGIILGVFISLSIKKPTLSFVFIGAALLLYFYSKKLKSLPLIGNLVVSFLVTINVLMLAIFDLNNSTKTSDYNFVISAVLIISFFAFFINLIREIIKDIEDINGDYKLNMNTLPILIGRYRTQYFVTILQVIFIIILVYFITKFRSTYKIIALYTLFFSVIPMLYITFKTPKLKSKKEFHQISVLLKIVMFLGINIFIILSFTQ